MRNFWAHRYNLHRCEFFFIVVVIVAVSEMQTFKFPIGVCDTEAAATKS